MVIGTGFFNGGLVLLIAGIYQMTKNNLLFAAIFLIYSCFFLTFIGYQCLYDSFGTVLPNGDALGIYYIFWSLFTIIMIYASSIKREPTITIGLVCLFISFLLIGISEFIDCKILKIIGGIFCMVHGSIFIYYASGKLINFQFGIELYVL